MRGGWVTSETVRGRRDWALAEAAGREGPRACLSHTRAFGEFGIVCMLFAAARGLGLSRRPWASGQRLSPLLHRSPYELFRGAVYIRLHEEVVAVTVILFFLNIIRRSSRSSRRRSSCRAAEVVIDVLRLRTRKMERCARAAEHADAIRLA